MAQYDAAVAEMDAEAAVKLNHFTNCLSAYRGYFAPVYQSVSHLVACVLFFTQNMQLESGKALADLHSRMKVILSRTCSGLL